MPHGVTNGRHGTGLTSLTITWLRQSCDSKAFQEVEEHIGATRVQNMALREVLCRPRTGGAVTSHNLSLSHVLFSLFLALSLSLAMFSLYLPPSRHHYCVAYCLTSIFAAYWKTPSWSTIDNTAAPQLSLLSAVLPSDPWVRNAEITVQCEELEVHSLQTKGEENSSYSRVSSFICTAIYTHTYIYTCYI